MLISTFLIKDKKDFYFKGFKKYFPSLYSEFVSVWNSEDDMGLAKWLKPIIMSDSRVKRNKGLVEYVTRVTDVSATLIELKMQEKAVSLLASGSVLSKDFKDYSIKEFSNKGLYKIDFTGFDNKGFYCFVRSQEGYSFGGNICAIYSVRVLGNGYYNNDVTGRYCNFEWFVIPNKYPRLLFPKPTCIWGNCSECETSGECTSHYDMYGWDEGLSICGIGKRINKKCKYFKSLEDTIGYSADEITKAVFYCIDRFSNRDIIMCEKPEELKVVTCKNGEYNYTRVSDYYKYQEQHKVSTGHHASPVEHTRKGHIRRYKSGKVVHVKPCTVNKGKGKATYKV